MERIDVAVAATLPSEELEQQIGEIVNEVLSEQRIQLNLTEQRQLVRLLVDDMLGLGPLEPLLADESVTDIMVNGAKQVYVERQGKLELTTVEFRDDQHVMNIATRIVTRIGRRIDESSPLVDARLEDGSRVNIIAPPLAIDGPSISIRKFAQKRITRKTSFQRMQAGIVLTVIAICLLVLILSWYMTIRFWRRQFERKKQAEDALLESEKKYRTIIETASSGCWQLDADEVTVDVNQALCDMLGYSKEEILGKMPFDFVDEANDPIFRDNVARTAPSVNRNYDVDLIRKNGDTVSARMDSTTLYDELGAVAGSFAFVTDITKRKRAEEKLKEMSLYDSLTGLYNRNFFEEEMTRLRDGGSSPVGSSSATWMV